MSSVSVKFDPLTMSSMFDHPSWTGVELEEFHLFPKLAAELRLMIWKACLPGPRLLVMPYSHPDADLVPRFTPSPLALSICKESREEALKNYHHIGYEMESAHPWMSHINYEIDTLYILDSMSHGIPYMYHPTGHNEVQSLILTMSRSEIDNPFVFISLKANYPNLKTLDVVLSELRPYRGPHIRDPALKEIYTWHAIDGRVLDFVCIDDCDEDLEPPTLTSQIRVTIKNTKKELGWNITTKLLRLSIEWGTEGSAEGSTED